MGFMVYHVMLVAGLAVTVSAVDRDCHTLCASNTNLHHSMCNCQPRGVAERNTKATSAANVASMCAKLCSIQLGGYGCRCGNPR